MSGNVITVQVTIEEKEAAERPAPLLCPDPVVGWDPTPVLLCVALELIRSPDLHKNTKINKIHPTPKLYDDGLT